MIKDQKTNINRLYSTIVRILCIKYYITNTTVLPARYSCQFLNYKEQKIEHAIAQID